MTYIGPHKVFAHLDRLLAWQQGARRAPVTVEWDLSNRCVLGCQDCHFAHTHTRGPWVSRPRRLPMAYDGTGDLADVVLVERALVQLAAADVRGVVWSGGGEPTTHPELARIVALAGALGLQQGMYTLGGLIDSTSPLGDLLDWVVVSLDAADAATYAAEKGVGPDRFDAALQGVTALVGRRAVVGLSFLLHAGNWTQAPHMLALGRQLGVGYVTFRPTVQTHADAPGDLVGDRSWVTAALPTLRALADAPGVEIDCSRFEAYRDWQGHGYASGCHGIKVTTTITPDGRVWVCPQRRGVEGSALGDLRTESFAALWARHPGRWTDFDGCRAMCRLHLINQALDPIFTPAAHEAFV